MSSKRVADNTYKIDQLLVNETLKEFEDFFVYLRSFHPSNIPNGIRSRLFIINEKCGNFLSYLDGYYKDSLSETKTDDSLWVDNFLFKYIFEDCITTTYNDTTCCVELFCLVCLTWMKHSSASLMEHLNDEFHLCRYKDLKSKQEEIWKNKDLYKWAFEKFIEFRYDETLYCKLCCVSLTFTQVNLISHLNGNKHMQKFKNIVDTNCTFRKEICEYPTSSNKGKSKPEESVKCKPSRKVPLKNNVAKSLKKETNKKSALKIKAIDKFPVSKDKRPKSVTRFAYYDPYSESSVEPKQNKMSNDTSYDIPPSSKHNIKSEISGCDGHNEERKIKKSDLKKKLEIKQCAKGEKDSFVKRKPDSDKNNSKKKPIINDKDIESHGVFMNKVLINKKPNVIKFFCHPCCFSEVLSSANSVNDHIASLKHQQFTKLKTNLAFMNYNSYYCQSCNVKFFCSEDFISYHNESKQHKQISHNFLRNDEFMQNVTEDMPPSFSCRSIETVESKDIQNDVFTCDINLLQTEMKILLKSLLKIPIERGKNGRYGFFCRACSFWTRKRNKWSAHLSCHNHQENMSFEQNFKTFDCECCVVLNCDDEFYHKHISSYEHKNLRSFVLQKSSAKKLKDLKKLEIKDNVDTKKMSINLNNSQINRGDIQPTQPKKLHESFFCFQLSGLPADIKEDDIYKSFSNFGEIECVEFTEPNSADVLICLRNDLSVSDVEGFTKRGLSVQIKGTSCEIKEKKKCELCDEIVVCFSKDRHGFFEKLLSDSVKESLSPIMTQRGEFLLKPDAVKDDVMKACEHVKAARPIGSRATALAQSDSMLDMFIEMYDSLGFEIDDSEVILKLDEVAKSFNDVKPPLFTNVKVEGYSVLADHNSTGLKCKFLLNNGLAIENTEVIRLYAKADKRIKQAILIIKEWVKFTDFPKFVSNYALTWMVLYYLMQPEVNLINPVKAIKDDRIEERRKISGWDCSLRKLVQAADLLKPDPKLTSIDSLVIGFFQFYGCAIDIACVHCPLSGEMMSKEKFIESEAPKLKMMNKTPFNVTKGLCLQDPFELNKNLTEKIQGSTLYQLKELSQQMITILSNKTDNDNNAR